MLAAQANTSTGREPHMEDKPKAPYGFIFLGTPHQGTRFAFLGRIFALFGYWVGSSDRLLNIIDRGSAGSMSLHQEFRRHFLTNEMTFYFETMPETIGIFPLTEVGAKYPS